MTHSAAKCVRMPYLQALAGNIIVETGIHKGKTFNEIVDRFPEYVVWCERHGKSIGFQKTALLEYASWVDESKAH